jgi:cytochrome P450
MLKDYKVAFDDVDRYLHALISTEKERIKFGHDSAGGRRDSLLSHLVRLDSDEYDPANSGVQTRRKMTPREIVGNTFIFSVAGHETTAVTFLYAMALLILNPKQQLWVQERLRKVLQKEAEDPQCWDSSLFLLLDAPLAIMVR